MVLRHRHCGLGRLLLGFLAPASGYVLVGRTKYRFGVTSFRSGRLPRYPTSGELVDAIFSEDGRQLISVWATSGAVPSRAPRPRSSLIADLRPLPFCEGVEGSRSGSTLVSLPQFSLTRDKHDALRNPQWHSVSPMPKGRAHTRAAFLCVEVDIPDAR